MKVGTDGVLLGAWAFGGIPPEREVRVLDVGCGTGVIALMLAQRFQSAIITGVEINSDAAGEAALNFSASSWGDRLSVTCSDFLEYAVMDGLPGFYDLIISNPPFGIDWKREATSVLSLFDGSCIGVVEARWQVGYGSPC